MRVFPSFLALLLAIALILCLSAISQAKTINVPADSSSIQGGINGAVDGDTVLVSPGTYYEHDIDFLGKAITVTGTDPEDSAVVAATVVDGDSLGSVFHLHSREDSTSVLQGLTITGGRANPGGGIRCSDSSPTIAYCVIVGNTAGLSGYTRGGGVYFNGSSAIVRNCIIRANTAHDGGGMIIWYDSPRITNCSFIANSVNFIGGGLSAVWSSPVVSNTTFTGNSADFGGGMRNYYSTPTITNSTFSGNSATSHGAGVHSYQSSPSVNNCILWGNVGEPLYDENSTTLVTYSDLEGGHPGIGNMDQDPLFRDPGNDDYRLQLDSPCIDTGDSTILDSCLPPGLGTDRSDMGAYGGAENCGWPPYNHRPSISTTPDTSAVAGLSYLYDVDASDSDGDTPRFSLQVAPAWLSIDSITGEVAGIPPMAAVGDTVVTVRVEDGQGGADEQSYGLTVLPQLNLTLTATGETVVPRGGILFFNTFVENNRANSVEGDHWLSVQLPDSTEFLIPGGLLNYANPLHGQIFGNGFVDLSNQLFVPTQADTGSYQLIGRVGNFPDTIIDEGSFQFEVVE
jgi:hypothetical protein